MRPSDGRTNLWPLAVIGFIVILAVASITPVVRLNATPPPDFAALRVAGQRPNAAEAARYWDAAVQVIQWKYDRTAALPAKVPAEFSPANGKTESAARQAYWDKLREEWLRADNWHRTVDFDLSWMIHGAESIWRELRGFVQDRT
jgi:hypothetical protein